MRMALKDEQTGKNKHFINSLEFAWQGIKTVFREERNMRKHVAFGVTAIVFGFLFSLTLAEWLWLLLAVFLVWLAEIINTIFENVVDMFTDFHFHPIGKSQRHGRRSCFINSRFRSASRTNSICTKNFTNHSNVEIRGEIQ